MKFSSHSAIHLLKIPLDLFSLMVSLLKSILPERKSRLEEGDSVTQSRNSLKLILAKTTPER